MKLENRKKFLEIVVGFAELKGKVLSAPALELFWNSMQAWTIEEFQSAANHLITTCEFMPTPKDFEDLRRAGRPTAGEAWIEARNTIRVAGWAQIESSSFSCGDELIDRAVRAIGGYRAIAMCDSDKLHFLERRFAEHFEQMQDAGDTRDAVPQLAGERTGRLTGPRSVGKLLERLGAAKADAS
jgi:hypothetical protein